MCALPSALPCQVSTASASVPSTSCSEKSTSMVVPPASAAAVPVSQSSAVTVPPKGMSMCVWPSMKPGMTRRARDVDDLGAVAGKVDADGGDGLAGHGDVGAERAVGGHHRAAGQDQVAHDAAPVSPGAADRALPFMSPSSSWKISVITSTMWSTSSSVSESGGARARTLSKPAAVSALRPSSSPRFCAAATSPADVASGAGARVARRPRPRCR